CSSVLSADEVAVHHAQFTPATWASAGELETLTPPTPSVAAVPDLARRRRFGTTKRREAKVTQPPPQIRSFAESDQQLVVRDLYDHLYREPEDAAEGVAGADGATGAAGAAGAAFYDRGDPAAADWANSDLAWDTAWHDLDLSGIVPAGCTAVLLRIEYVISGGTALALWFRREGNSNDVNSARAVATDDAGFEFVVGVSGQKINYRALTHNVADTVNITVAGWWA
ncbi:MAG TPA: hypothetical protein VM283_09660, partial [Armatimonadota bacterium]|nr:hypothetical protein [Armatimonadota bacterium]